MLFILESNDDYPKEDDGTIHRSGKLNFFFKKLKIIILFILLLHYFLK